MEHFVLHKFYHISKGTRTSHAVYLLDDSLSRGDPGGSGECAFPNVLGCLQERLTILQLPFWSHQKDVKELRILITALFSGLQSFDVAI